MLKIRLRRMGSRHRPFYRVVVSDSRRTPTAAALDELGYYDPRRSPSVFKVDMDKVDHWLAKGAQPSDTVNKLVRKARKGEVAGADAGSAEDAKATEEAVTEEKPAEVKAEAAEEAEATEEAPAAAEETDDNSEDKAEA